MRYTKTCPGLKRQNNRREMGSGSHTDNSQTSSALLGYARESADSGVTMSAIYRRGEGRPGDDETLTRRAEGVEGFTSTFASKSRYFRVRVMV